MDFSEASSSWERARAIVALVRRISSRSASACAICDCSWVGDSACSSRWIGGATVDFGVDVLLGELVVVGTGELDVEEEDDVVVGSGDVDDVAEVSVVVDGSDVVVDGSDVVLVVLVTASAVVVPVVAVSVAAAGPRPVIAAVARARGTAASHVLRPALPRSDTGLLPSVG